MSKSNPDDWLKEVFELSMLYDFYGELLSESSKNVFENYVLNDMSLSEIANETGISRQGIHDTIKRTIKKLNSYEEKLHLVEKFRNVKEDVSKIKEIAESIVNSNEFNTEINQILALSQNIYDSY